MGEIVGAALVAHVPTIMLPEETRRELYRHSPRDADAYVEFGRLMQRMAMAVKPAATT